MMVRWVLAVVLSVVSTAATAAPQRIVSLNLCADQLLLQLVPRERIASLTWLAADPLSSAMADQARGIPANSGSAEEVLRFKPDLVLAGIYTTRTSVNILRRAGIPVVELGVPSTLSEASDQILDLAAELGETGQGREIVSAMEERLSRQTFPALGPRPRALVLGAYGVAAGPGSILDDIVERAGFESLSPSLAKGGETGIPLETAIMSGPDALIVDEADRGPALANEILSHSVLRALRGRVETIALPSRLWSCAGPHLADAVEVLRTAAVRISARTLLHPVR
ncbi:ABC transporter substrate-binding protein [Terrihabitans sp. B22-R8]|uniref:ABC transporter substrate-binding protein n=1 Tax=Terrihabitans sp. B22-R8 TaxID=3425128 RepID=UPI00403CE9A1